MQVGVQHLDSKLEVSTCSRCFRAVGSVEQHFGGKICCLINELSEATEEEDDMQQVQEQIDKVCSCSWSGMFGPAATHITWRQTAGLITKYNRYALHWQLLLPYIWTVRVPLLSYAAVTGAHVLSCHADGDVDPRCCQQQVPGGVAVWPSATATH
jgi:hypothetical protein